jgi:uncharacterized protein (TIGR02284 family)
MTGLFTKRRPPLRRVLLIESGSRQVAEQFLQRLYQSESCVQADVLTCFPTPPKTFQSRHGQVFDVTDPAIVHDRQRFLRKTASTPYDVIAILQTGSRILRNWKWTLAILTRAKILLVKENADSAFLDYGYLQHLKVDLPRFRREQVTQLRLAGEVLLMPFTISYLLLYAGRVHLRRLLQFPAPARQKVHMADDNTRILKALNDLIATCHDAEEGYAKAAKGVHDHELSDHLTGISGQRGKFADELGSVVGSLGGSLATDAHYGGILHSGWVDLETRIRPKNEHDILDDCRRGDEGTLKHYDHALAQELPEQARAIAERQRNAIQNDLDQLSSRISHAKGHHV